MIRTCGACRACCAGPPIAELHKAQFETCLHLAELGCGVYAARPGSCRHYACLWLSGTTPLSEEERPDRLGVYFSLQPSKYEHTGEVVSQVLDAWESWPSAIDSDAAQEAVRRVIDFARQSTLPTEGMEVVRHGEAVYSWIRCEGGLSLDERTRDLAGEEVVAFERRRAPRRLDVVR